MKTTVEICDEHFREARSYAGSNGISPREVVERMPGKPFRLKTLTTRGEGLICDDNWPAIRSLAYEGHGGWCPGRR